jgi:chromosome segregation ATPase
MDNEEFDQKQKSQSENSESFDSKTLNDGDNQSTEIKNLRQQLHQLKEVLKDHSEKVIENEGGTEEQQTVLGVQIENISSLENELEKVHRDYQFKIQEKVELITNFENQLTQAKQEAQILKAELEPLKVTLEHQNNIIETQKKMIEEAQFERQTYVAQIAKLQEVIEQTENEIDEIQADHLEIQNQLRLEIKRLEERAGQISEDLSRDARGKLARDRHIRAFLGENELGRILLYIIDYFEDSKKRSLNLAIMSSELGITPIIARRSLRHLHELGVCDFNEVSREIKLLL